jgi:valyl-tRNA synthetase
MPKSNGYDANILEQFEKVKEIIAGVRTIRQEKNIAIKQQLSTSLRTNSKFNGGSEANIVKLAGLENLSMLMLKLMALHRLWLELLSVYNSA